MHPDDLLLGPRGRRLCLDVAHRLDQDVWSAWLHAAWNLGDADRRDTLVRAIRKVDATAVLGWSDPLTFLEPVDAAVTSAMYWQPPHDEDVIAAHPDVVEALRPLAAAIALSPAAAWWTTPLELTSQRLTAVVEGDDRPALPALDGFRAGLARWRSATLDEVDDAARDRPSDPTAPYSGCWWSTPVTAPLVSTSRSLPGLGAVELVWREDGSGESDAVVWALRTIREPRVWEIDTPRAWTDLVRRYPLDVTSARLHDWYRTTGRAGTWLVPDWSEVAADFDAVHLTVAGYLTTATRALPVSDDATATVLAGWNPDQTWWLTDILEAARPDPERWHNPDDDPAGPDFAWRRKVRGAQ